VKIFRKQYETISFAYDVAAKPPSAVL